MIDYSKGKIYRLLLNDEEYVGSTTSLLCVRKAHHKNCFVRNKNGKAYEGKTSSYNLFEKGEPEIILIENYPCKTKEELHKREREVMEERRRLGIKIINFSIPTQTAKERYENNKPARLQKIKDYNKNHKEEIKIYKSLWNKERVKCEKCEREVSRCNFLRHKKKCVLLKFL
jgi:hypothetical protein